MCKRKKTYAPMDCDVFIVDNFYSDDIIITGNLFIGGTSACYADNVEVGRDIYILSDEEASPSVDALSLKAYGIIETNCLGSITANEVSALEGCFCTD